MANKVIITCAITGGIHTPTLSDALPYKPADLAHQAIEAAEAGAAILHIHARDPETGAPTGNPEVYRQFLPIIKQGTDAVINLTTGGSPDMSPEDRLAGALAFSPEMCSLNMGSMNFSFHDMGRKVKEWKFPWEDQYILDSEKFIFRNTFADIRRNYELLSDHGTRFEHECYDIGHLYTAAHFIDRGLIKAPFLIQSVFGILGGIRRLLVFYEHSCKLPVTISLRDFGMAALVLSYCRNRRRCRRSYFLWWMGWGRVLLGRHLVVVFARGM